MECEYLNSKDLAELIGVTRQSIYNWRKRGKLPKETWIGPRTQRWNKREFLEWLEARRIRDVQGL